MDSGFFDGCGGFSEGFVTTSPALSGKYNGPFCPHPGCHSRDVEWTTVSGKGKLHSYVIAHRAHPAFAAPYVIAVVTLDEGPKMMTNILIDDPKPETLPADAPVEIVYETVNEKVTLPKFRLV